MVATENRETGSHFIDVQQLEWQPTQFPGITMKILWQDDQSDSFTGLFRCEPGAQLPLHRHADVEQTYVLEGSLVDDTGTCTTGNFVWRERGSVHAAHSPDGCLLLGIFQKPNEFLDPDSENSNSS